MQISSPGSATTIGCRASTIAAVTGGFFLGTANSLSSALGSPYGAAALAPEDGVRTLEYVAA